VTTSVDYHATVVVVPTRNRAALAMNALRSALNQSLCGHVLVSPNSSSEEERAAPVTSLRRDCRRAGAGSDTCDELTFAPSMPYELQEM
jgi:hypothetical protein